MFLKLTDPAVTYPKLCKYQVNISRETVRLILTEELRWEKFVPKISHSNEGMQVWAQFLAPKCFIVMLQPPCSPDIATCDFFLFPKVETTLKGHHFESTEDTQKSITYLLTPRNTVLLEKLTGLQLVKKFPPFYGTRRFINAFTRARHLWVSWTSSIQSITPHPTSWRSILTFRNPASYIKDGHTATFNTSHFYIF
jgi:hypothetical protein